MSSRVYCSACERKIRSLFISATVALVSVIMAAIIVIVSLSQGVKPDEEVLSQGGKEIRR